MKFEGTRQFFISVETPQKARFGEQIGVRVDVFNFQNHRIEVIHYYYSNKLIQSKFFSFNQGFDYSTCFTQLSFY
jgi:hypothetical protein